MFGKNIKRSFIYNIRLMIIGFAVVMIWRGIWNFLDHYLFPEFFIFSNIISIFIGVLLLLFLEKDLENLSWETDI